MRFLVVCALCLLAGCPGYDSPWTIRVALERQSIARDELGISQQAAVLPGDAWLSLHSWEDTDVVYPVVADATGELQVESPFEPTVDEAHGVLLTWTRLSRDTEPAEKHPDVQYATILIDSTVVPTAREFAASASAPRLTLELAIKVPPTCGVPPPSFGGNVEGCLTGAGTTCDRAPLAIRDGLYRAGPLGVFMEVMSQDCVE